MTLDELNTLIRDTIEVATGLATVIKYNPNAPRPKGEYATVHIAELKRIGIIDIKYDNVLEDVGEKVILQYEAMVSCNFYRGAAMQYSGLFAGSLNANFVVAAFNALRVGFVRPSAVRDLTQLIDQGQEERAQVDVFVAFELTPTINIVTGVDTVKVVGDIDNSAEVVDSVEIITP